MLPRIPAILLVLVGLLNFYPLVGVHSAESLANLYGITAPQGDLLILLRHRAILLGIIGGFMLLSVFRRKWQPTAIALGFVSMISFILIAGLSGDHGASIHRVMLADVAGCLALGVLVIIRWVSSRS